MGSCIGNCTSSDKSQEVKQILTDFDKKIRKNRRAEFALLKAMKLMHHEQHFIVRYFVPKLEFDLLKQKVEVLAKNHVKNSLQENKSLSRYEFFGAGLMKRPHTH